MQSFNNKVNQLSTNQQIQVIGIYDVLSAIVALNEGFQDLWISSFSLSASSGLPDLNLIAVTEVVDLCQKIKSKVDCNLIIDVETCYGSERNAYRMTKEFMSVGVNTFCLEDTIFPKSSSLYVTKNQKLEDLKTQCKKIAAIKRAGNSETFVIARTEGFNVGADIKTILERTDAYVEAGADALLIHSVKSTPIDLFEFADKWKKQIPLVAVPTTYFVDYSDLEKAGYKVIIFANQLIRATASTLSATISQIKESKNLKEINNLISTVDELKRMTFFDEYNKIDNEK